MNNFEEKVINLKFIQEKKKSINKIFMCRQGIINYENNTLIKILSLQKILWLPELKIANLH